MDTHRLGKVPDSPTSPGAKPRRKAFDVASLYSRASEGEAATGLDEKFRKAYYWITNYAIITPFYDIEFDEAGASPSYPLGDSKARLILPSAPSYSSFVLVPLLNLIARKKCLFVGGPGRGKTASALLMGVLSGYPLKEVKRAVQHGQPQMSVADLFGSPVPSDMMKSETLKDIRVAWKSWLGMRVKIVDEYNRIPTRTQSALLTVMADDYAEMMDQIYECPEAAWYLTANDDSGGGTYQVIEALKDRIDVTVRALHFNSRFIDQLLSRVEAGIKPEEAVPAELVFTEEELDAARSEALSTAIPREVLRRVERFAAQLEFMESAGVQFEYRTKDSVKVSGVDYARLSASETGKDKVAEIGNRTKNGLSVRAIMTSLSFMKAIAWFRGKDEVGLDDARAALPFALHDKLVPNLDSPWFAKQGNEPYAADRVAWIRQMFDESCAEYDRLGLDSKDEVGEALRAVAKGFGDATLAEAEAEIARLESMIQAISQGRKLNGPLYDDALALKYLHQRWSAYARWLRWRS
jgi:MoxR-like ATPase